MDNLVFESVVIIIEDGLLISSKDFITAVNSIILLVVNEDAPFI